MSACAAASNLAHASLEKSAFDLAGRSPKAASKFDKSGRAGQVKQILRQAGLTMCQVSALTCMRYGKKSPYFVPPTFLYKQKNGITPHICQIVALSQVTGHRFADWMNVCGFDLKLIFALQLAVHTERTTIVTPIDTGSGRDSSIIPWSSRPGQSNRRYFFAKIGSRDAVVYPKIMPGSVVRADRCYSPRVLDVTYTDELFWLVEHPGGLACCHVKRVDDQHIVLLPSRPPLSAWPLHLSREARILGLVDLELRPRQSKAFEPMYIPTEPELRTMAPHGGSGMMSFSRLLRRSRARNGLTLRAAHQMTLHVAELLRNRDYSIPLGLLSDYEATNKLPRHIAKLMSLCIIYGIDFWEMMEAGGSRIDDSGSSHLFISPQDETNDLLRSA